MQRIFAASAAFLAALVIAGQAAAADLGRRAMPVKAPEYMAPIYLWTGSYIGINGGGGWGNSKWDSAAAPTGNFDVSGGLIGGTIGYNWQNGPFVFGLEGDIDWSDIRGTTTTNCAAGCETRNTWLGTGRGRIGYAFDRFLPYVTGGVAFGGVEANRPGFGGASETQAGWALGGGIEFALAGNWSAKAEYLYVDLGSFDCGTRCGATAPDNVDFSANIFRAGLNYRF
ncbi:MAG: outer membrane protein [Pseudorhodoplanes sp.]